MKENNVSNERLLYLKKRRIGLLSIHFTRITLLVLFLFLWEFSARLNLIDSFLFSMPSQIILTIKNLAVSGELWLHIGTTLLETLLGFIIATVVGTAIALLLWWSDFFRKVCEPFIVVLNGLPKIALGPIIIVWFGAGVKSIVFMAIIITIIVTIITMQNGFLATDKGKIFLLKSLGATKFEILLKLVIPSSLPTFTSCLKINVGMAWIGSIMGEYLVSKQGIGYLIVYGGQVFKLDLVMAASFILCMLAAAMYFLVVLVEKIVIKKTN